MAHTGDIAMTDLVKVELSQVDEETGTRISYVLAEWVGSDRDTANAMTMGLIGSMVGAVDGWRTLKSEGVNIGKPNYGENPNGLIKSR